MTHAVETRDDFGRRVIDLTRWNDDHEREYEGGRIVRCKVCNRTGVNYSTTDEPSGVVIHERRYMGDGSLRDTVLCDSDENAA